MKENIARAYLVLVDEDPLELTVIVAFVKTATLGSQTMCILIRNDLAEVDALKGQDGLRYRP